jgi:two-component system NtrC family response regulator
MGSVLIIDDDQMMCKAMSGLLQREGHEVVSASTLQSGMQKASTEPFDIVLLDVMMPDGNGLNIVTEIKETHARPEVIIITAAGDPDGAELAIRSGAWDYVEKSYSLKKMILPVSRVLQYRKEKLATNLPAVLEIEGIIAKSPKMKACIDLLVQAGRSDANVMLTGETGTGKELFARAIHNHWRQNNSGSSADPNSDNTKGKDRNFVVVDCTALPETLVESVLFGHVKGAFTGADRSQDGLIKQADGGTLFLDEIGELPHKIQKRFLRVLQERRFRPVGGKEEIESNFRLIAATNRNLAHMVENEKFRKDLLFRLQSLTIELPSLCEHSEDINELARFHVARLCERNRMETKSFSPDLLDALQAYNWPGNVRELVNTLEGALAVAGEDPILFSKHLPMHIRVHLARKSVDENKQNTSNPDTDSDLNKPLPEFRAFRKSLEKDYLQKLISYSKRDIKRACQISGLSRSRLYELFSNYSLSMSDSK